MAEVAEVKNKKEGKSAPPKEVTKRKRPPRAPASRPIFKQKLVVQSLQGQRIMNKSFEYVERSLFRLGVILRIIGEAEQIDEVNAVIQKFESEVKVDFQEHEARLCAILNQNGLGDDGMVDDDSLCEFTSPETYEIDISTPQLRQFIALLSNLDRVIQKTDTLWLMGAFSDKQRMIANYQAQQRLFRFAGRIIGLERRARFAAYKKGREQEVEAEAPKAEQDAAEKGLVAAEKGTDNVSEALQEELGVPEKETEPA
ncbi:hypothetical protein ACH42_02870 [Endozoicomonas sp. (ex Bugula neritina AB1)]|nr:hypothetical protein ACH42_02870 [Endozoicomonas sp. (ex Bugula neritina AB1)]